MKNKVEETKKEENLEDFDNFDDDDDFLNKKSKK